MGYFVNKLMVGCQYDIEGRIYTFKEKNGDFYVFNDCVRDDFSGEWLETDEKESFFLKKEIMYIKLFNCSNRQRLKKIGKDKVFPRN
jgi:hypothetical protein